MNWQQDLLTSLRIAGVGRCQVLKVYLHPKDATFLF